MVRFFFNIVTGRKPIERIAQGKAKRHPGLLHVGDGRAESAKAWITAGYLTLLRLQRVQVNKHPIQLVINFATELQEHLCNFAGE